MEQVEERSPRPHHSPPPPGSPPRGRLHSWALTGVSVSRAGPQSFPQPLHGELWQAGCSSTFPTVIPLLRFQHTSVRPPLLGGRSCPSLGAFLSPALRGGRVIGKVSLPSKRLLPWPGLGAKAVNCVPSHGNSVHGVAALTPQIPACKQSKLCSGHQHTFFRGHHAEGRSIWREV